VLTIDTGPASRPELSGTRGAGSRSPAAAEGKSDGSKPGHIFLLGGSDGGWPVAGRLWGLAGATSE
jgi:hypothetical protein